MTSILHRSLAANPDRLRRQASYECDLSDYTLFLQEYSSKLSREQQSERARATGSKDAASSRLTFSSQTHRASLPIPLWSSSIAGEEVQVWHTSEPSTCCLEEKDDGQSRETPGLSILEESIEVDADVEMVDQLRTHEEEGTEGLRDMDQADEESLNRMDVEKTNEGDGP